MRRLPESPVVARESPVVARVGLTRVWGPLLAAGFAMLLGVVLRLPTAAYTGPPTQHDFNAYIFQYLGAYSDITSLWFRDQLWNHPVPYVDYAVEYPVGMGLLIWLINSVNRDVMPYFYASAAVLIACGLLTVWLGSRFERSNMWLLALSPALPLYVALNWDLAGIVLTVVALLLLRHERDGWGGLALSAAVWTKFFPIVLVPLALFDRVLRGRWRAAATFGGVFAASSVAINAPFAIERTTSGWGLREAWLFFFRFNQQRGREVNFWNFFDPWNLTLEQINVWSALLLIIGLSLIALLMAHAALRDFNRGRDLLLPAALAAIGWFFFINKVYSPQYSLWLVVLLALLAAPPALVVAFAGADVLYFAASFIILYLSVTQNPATGWFYDQALFPAMALREAVIFGMIVYALWRLARRDAPDARVAASAHVDQS